MLTVGIVLITAFIVYMISLAVSMLIDIVKGYITNRFQDRKILLGFAVIMVLIIGFLFFLVFWMWVLNPFWTWGIR
jgi:hypothetical protein